MRPIIRFAILSLVVLCAAACAGTAKSGIAALDNFPPDVSGGPTVTWYDVHGRTAAEVDFDLRREGPKAGAKPIIDEYWNPIDPHRVEFRQQSNGISCGTLDARVYLTAHLTLPRFTPPPDADPDLAGEWNAFQQYVLQHEITHKNIAGQAAQDLATRLNTFSTSCMTFTRDLYVLINNAIVAEQRAQREFDVETLERVQQASVQHLVTSTAADQVGRRAVDMSALGADSARAKATAPHDYVSPLAEPSLSDVAKKAARVTVRPDSLTLGIGGLLQLDAFTVTVYDSSGAELRHLINGAYDVRMPHCAHLIGAGRQYRVGSEGTCELEVAFPGSAWTRPDSAPSARVILRFTR